MNKGSAKRTASAGSGQGTVPEGTGCKLAEQKIFPGKADCHKGVRRGEAAILTQLEGGGRSQ